MKNLIHSKQKFELLRSNRFVLKLKKKSGTAVFSGGFKHISSEGKLKTTTKH